MKKIIYYLTGMLILLAFGACSSNIDIKEMADLKGYGQVYMPQANNEPVINNVLLNDSTYELSYSAFYGGFDKAESDIPVTFSIAEDLVAAYNEKHGKTYTVLPAASYEIPEAATIIPKGANSSAIMKIKLKPTGTLEVFKPYLLPVTLQSSSAPINERLKTVYYEVAASFAAGAVPREKVLSISNFQGGKIISFVNGQLITKNPNGTLSLYSPDSNGIFGSPRQIGQGWQNFRNLFYFAPNRIVGSIEDVVQYGINEQGQFGASKAIGWGWGFFAHIIPYDKYLMGIRTDGLVTSYEFNAAGDLNWGNIRDIARDWNKYDLMFQYENSLLAREPNGNLWQIPMSDSGLPQTAQQRGTGWDMYTSIVCSGSDLLALDSEGNIWRYKFVPRGNWQLKK